MRHYNIGKKLFAYGMISVMSVGLLVGCGKTDTSSDNVYTAEEASSTLAMVIGDYDVYLDELMVYAIQDITSYGVTPATLEADTATYKEQTLSLIRETKIIYDVALHNDVELGDSDIEAKDKLVDSFKSSVPAEILTKYGISDEIIDKVFTERTYVEKFENDIKNSMGQDIYDDIMEVYEDYNFQTMYQIVFPTVEVDENDEPKTDDDGNYVKLSDDDKELIRENAESALSEIRDGEDPETVADKYGVSAYSDETQGYVGAYSDDMNELLADVKAGECTDVIEGDMGYTIIYMKTVNDEELRDSYVYAVTQETLDPNYEQVYNSWLASIPVDVDGDMRGDAWESFDMIEMSQDLYDAGLVKASTAS